MNSDEYNYRLADLRRDYANRVAESHQDYLDRVADLQYALAKYHREAAKAMTGASESTVRLNYALESMPRRDEMTERMLAMPIELRPLFPYPVFGRME